MLKSVISAVRIRKFSITFNSFNSNTISCESAFCLTDLFAKHVLLEPWHTKLSKQSKCLEKVWTASEVAASFGEVSGLLVHSEGVVDVCQF